MQTDVRLDTDILILGSGIAGLQTALRCARMGYRVVIAEQAPTLSSGATTRSGDLVHAGGFHSALIDDETRALETGRHCAEGHHQTLIDCPEGVRQDAAPVFLAIHNQALVERALTRWRKLGIRYQQVSEANALAKIQLTGFTPPAGTHFFQTEDKPFDWRLYCQKLKDEIEQLGGRILLSAQLITREPGCCYFNPDHLMAVTFNHLVHTTGFGMPASLETHRPYFTQEIQTEVWKSLSLIVPRVNRHGFLFVDRGFPSFMPAGDRSIINVSQLDHQTQHIDFSEDPRQRPIISEALSRIGLSASSLSFSDGEYRTCLKPNLITPGGMRKVNVSAIQLSPEDIIGLPGKATTAHLLAKDIANLIVSH